jgi:Protein of unknown function (DUF2953)
MTFFLALLWIIFSLLVLVLAIASAPVVLRARFQTSPCVCFQLQVSPLGGLIPFLTLVDSASAKPKDSSQTKCRKKPRSKKNLPSGGAKRMIRNVPHLLGDILRQFKFRKLVVEARFGLGDPADTGTVFGAFCPIIYGVLPARRFCIDVVPDYERACFDGSIDAIGTIIPLRLVPPFIRFSWRSFGSGYVG